MRRLRRPLIISFFLGMLIQVSGINTIIDYAPCFAPRDGKWMRRSFLIF
jgi:hypothetical protein